MKRVTGIGGVFLKARDAAALREWYRKHLGIPVESWGGTAFHWKSPDNPTGTGMTVWSIFERSSSYMEPGQASVMLNYRVDNLFALLDTLRAEGCQVDSKVDVSDYGKFGWVIDPEGNRVELWEPPQGS